MFLNSRSAMGEDRSPWGDWWFEPVGMRTATGQKVSADGAMRLAAVFACVRVLSEAMASLPFVLYEERAGGGKNRITGHWLHRLMLRPNRNQNGFEWREMMQAHLTLRGNGYNRIISNAQGEITELAPMHPDMVKPELSPSGALRYRFQTDAGETVLPAGEVFHLRGLSSNGLTGLSPVDYQREAIGMGLAAQDFGARFFANDARPMGGWIKMPGNFKDKAARDTFRESWQAAQSGGNRGKTAVLEGGMEFHEIGLTNKDSQFIEARKFQVTDIARIFRVPPHMIGDLERATFSNIEQQSLEFVTYTMTPWAERWEAAIEAQLLTDGSGLEVEFDFGNLLRGDAKTRAEYYGSGILNGWLTRNEARLAENLNPLDGLDEPLAPLNMVGADNMPDPDANGAPGGGNAPANGLPGNGSGSGGSGGSDDGEDPADARAAIRQRIAGLITGNARRISRRLAKDAKFDDSDAVVIADALAVPFAAARLWCEQARARAAGNGADQPGTAWTEATLAPALERLAATGIPPATLPEAFARIADAIAAQPAPVVHVAGATINVATPDVKLNMPVNIAAHVEANRPITKTVVAKRHEDGSLTAEVTEL